MPLLAIRGRSRPLGGIMKILLSTAVIAVALGLGSFAVSAQDTNGAYCATMKSDQNAAKPNCAYKTMADCEEAVKGGMGTCAKNTK
jgi:hypothetical protein